MIYVGYFSFDETGPENQARHGYFSGMVEAADIDRAVETFKARIAELKRSCAAMQSVVAVYIEDIVEFEHPPAQAVITRLQSSEGAFPESISHTLPENTHPGVQAYGYRPDVDALQIKDDENFQEMTPFMQF